MKPVFTLIMIMLSSIAFSQTVLDTETFPNNKFNSASSCGQSDLYTGKLATWSLKSSANTIIKINYAPNGGTITLTAYSQVCTCCKW